MDDDFRAEELQPLDAGRQAFAALAHDGDEFRPDTERHRRTGRRPVGEAAARAAQRHRAAFLDLRGDQVDPRLADELRHLDMLRIVVDHLRGGELQQRSADHHGHAIGHRQRLGLVVGDVERRHAGAAVQVDDLAAGMHAQVRIEVGQRLVHQEDRGTAHHGAGERHALALAAGHLPRLAVEQVVDPERRRHLAHVALDARNRLAPAGHQGTEKRQAPGARQPPHHQRHGDVLRRRQMRIERVGLEDHRDVAVGGMGRGHVAAGKHDLAAVGRLEPGENAQERALAASGRADQRDELARFRLQRHPLEDLVAAEGFRDVAENERAHSAAAFFAARG